MEKLSEQELEALSTYPWYHSWGVDSFGRYEVFVKYMNLEVLTTIPQKLNSKDVIVSFSSYKEAKAAISSSSPYIPVENYKPIYSTDIDISAVVAIKAEDDEAAFLASELWDLKKMCGVNNLTDIFFEIEDGKEAITKKAVKFPQVKKRLEKLLDKFGFDVLFEELGLE